MLFEKEKFITCYKVMDFKWGYKTQKIRIKLNPRLSSL